MQGNKIAPRLLTSPKADLTSATLEVEEVIGKELKKQKIKMFEEINEETHKQILKMTREFLKIFTVFQG